MTHFIILFLLSGLAALSSPSSAQSIYFDDAAPDLVRLGNASFYEVGLRKTNGAILYIIDKTTGQRLTLGSRYEQLWGAVFPNARVNYVGGASYTASGANKFSYNWADTPKILTLHYQPDPAATAKITATVTLTASAQNYFDLQIHLQNNWGDTLERVLFPSDLVFRENEIEEALLPILPGVLLGSSFFLQGRSYTTRYPGYPGVFADYVSLKLKSGRFALYTLYDQRPVPIVDLGFVHDDAYVAQTTFFTHAFRIQLDDEKSWTSPMIRVRVAEPHRATIENFRVDNHIEQLPPVANKLDADFKRVALSPLLKADMTQLAQSLGLHKFAEYDSLLPQLPSPAIFHPVAFQPRGFDENYPDFLPPNPAFGTTAELRALFNHAHEHGLFVMPYTNPTWWDDESPTLRNLPPPLTIDSIAVIGENGRPVYETYNGKGGYVVSRCQPFVRQRIDRLVQEMTTELPSDFLFEDQIGARPALYDFNKSCATPLGYVQSWLDHTRKHSAKRLATELGFDRLLETVTAFHGSVLLPERFGFSASWWGNGNWRYYPFTSLLAHDKALFYQHDLAPETMTMDKATLSWNLAFGFMLSYDLYAMNVDTLNWRDVAATFQSHVVSRYAGEKMSDYNTPAPGITQSDFTSVTVLTNWNAASYTTGPHTIPALGTLATSNDGRLTAGIFTAYNNKPLSPNDHYLVVEIAPKQDSIKIWQPLGRDTPLSIERPSAWPDAQRIHAFAVGRDKIIEITKSVTAKEITFDWKRQIANVKAEYYALTSEVVVAVERPPFAQPADFRLLQNYPNPFNAATKITFVLPHASEVKLEVFNLVGERVAMLATGRFAAGDHAVSFDANNLPSGVYVYRIQAGRFGESLKLVVVR